MYHMAKKKQTRKKKANPLHKYVCILCIDESDEFVTWTQWRYHLGTNIYLKEVFLCGKKYIYIRLYHLFLFLQTSAMPFNTETSFASWTAAVVYHIILLSFNSFFVLLLRPESLLGEFTREPTEKINSNERKTRKRNSKWNVYYLFEQISANVVSKYLQHFRQMRTVYFGLFFSPNRLLFSEETVLISVVEREKKCLQTKSETTTLELRLNWNKDRQQPT